MEQISTQALPLLEEKSNPDAIEDDWVTNFFDKCRLISDKEMQSLWSKVLAGEANAPEKYSTRTDAVTGAFGYSGKYIASRLLDMGHDVITLANFTPLPARPISLFFPALLSACLFACRPFCHRDMSSQ